MSIVFILCISSDGVILRLVSVLSYVMVEKVERLLRGQWSALNIYPCLLVSSFVSLARLVGRLVAVLLICPSGRLVVLVNSLGGSLPRLVKQSAFSRFGLSSRFSSCGIGSCSPSRSYLISFVASHSRRDGVGSSFSSRGGVPSSPLLPRRGIRFGDGGGRYECAVFLSSISHQERAMAMTIWIKPQESGNAILRWGNMGAMGNGDDGDDMSRLDEQEGMINDEYDDGTDGNNDKRERDAITRRQRDEERDDR